ncbi:dephospho-CoA kinase [Anatilimnocola floriformis]|uniref:dephospho-CoA kinase n=1 Tax=Anatilimnocola floriformis TaxID=2948575 RepID=UPI0020C2030A|nr:dephospho-CoA kinase [Anatilimnocola floriformis]
MLTIGLIGGVASGKSAVAKLFAQLGAVILDADQAGHEVLHEPAVIAQLVARWGRGILTDSGQINRSAVAKIVFAPGNETERQFLNSVSHPRIAVRLKAQLDELREASAPAAVVDAALLLEAGWDQLCDQIVFVDVPQEQRLARARTRGWDAGELARREATQLPLETKRQRASICLLNDGSFADLEARVVEIAKRWRIAPRTA